MDRIPADAMVVVADGESARVFRNVGTDGALSLQQQELLTSKQLGDDSPSGVAPTEQSPHEADEATFAKQLAHRLNHGALTNAYAHLVLVADPQTLGQMRPQLHKETLQRMHGELAKTLTNSSVHDIERSLS
jgi:protein required for attachment to host cells